MIIILDAFTALTPSYSPFQIKIMKLLSARYYSSAIGRIIVTILLCGIGGVGSIGAQGHNHHGLQFSAVNTTFTLVDPDFPNDPIVVTWKPKAKPTGLPENSHDYVVTVKIPAAVTKRPYSMLTLGLQGRVQPRKLTCTQYHAEVLYTSKEGDKSDVLKPKETVRKFNEGGKADYGTLTFSKAATFHFEVTEVAPPSNLRTIWHKDAPTAPLVSPKGKGSGFIEHENDPPKNPPD